MQSIVPSSSLPPDVGEGEVLTGAELYHYLLEENSNQLQRAETKIAEYTNLKATLESITDRCRRPLLAPVANGLAYFEAELESTNNILVLLGDGWFAERSAVQAVEIAQRRLDFLRREQQVLIEEKKSLGDRQEMFLTELPQAEPALRKVIAAAAPSPTSTAKGVDIAHQSGPEGIADVDDPALTTFDEQDDLTEDELIALEAELADRIDDDEYVEKVMLERMIAKKEARVRATLEKHHPQDPEKEESDLRAREKEEETGATKAVVSDPLPSEMTKYRSPADILASYTAETANRMKACISAEADTTLLGIHAAETAAALESDKNAPGALKLSPGASPARKSVTFSDTVEVCQGAQPPTSAPMAPPAPTTATNKRVAYAVGEVVEHREPGTEGRRGGGGVPPLTPVFPATATGVGITASPKKRRSLFRREVDGE